MGRNNTESERLFKRFCEDHNIPCKKIEEQQRKTPDFALTPNGHEIVAEVKELQSGQFDSDHCKRLQNGERFVAFSAMDERIRRFIEKAYEQLEPHCESHDVPGLIVIYNCKSLDCPGPDNIRIAMFGDEVVTVKRERDFDVISPLHARPNENRNWCCEDRQTALSAVSLMYHSHDELRICLYHNHFATRPIDPDWIRLPNVGHCRLSRSHYEWESC